MAVQLVGYDPQAMADAARIAVDRGAGIVDINFGCPAKKVVGKLCGSALMREEGLATRIMGAVVEAVPVPVTMKMRLGWDEGEKNAPNLAKAAESVGIQMLTVHGRTRAQRYRGSADWNAIRPTVESTSLPVIANGDIEGPESIDQALKQSGAAGVMLGRAVQGRPWRISQAMAWISRGEWPEEPDATARGEMALEHFEDLLQLHGPVTGVLKSRTHLSNWVKGLEGATRFREEVFRLDSPDQVRRRIEVFFANTTVANSTDLAA